MPKKILICGGTSGLGLELAKLYSSWGNLVFIAGRKNPQIEQLHYVSFSLNHSLENSNQQIDFLLAQVKSIDLFIYATGYNQSAQIDQLSNSEIAEMVNVGLYTPAILVQKLKKAQSQPLELIFITSSSQYTPRENEPMYTATKAGLGMLGASLSYDSSLGKLMVVAPSGIKTPFWNSSKDVSEYLEPQWVAEQIGDLFKGIFKYRYTRIIRSPARVEIIETR